MRKRHDSNNPDKRSDLSDLTDSDEALFMRWRQHHDKVAFQTIDDRYRPRLLALVERTIKRNPASAAAAACDADDIVQDVFTALHNCPDPIGSVRKVLNQAVRSHLLDMIRASKAEKRDYRKTVHSDEMSYHVADPRAEPAVRDTEIEVREAVARLPVNEQQAVRLELDGHSHASGAEAAKVRQTTYWSRLRSAKKRLKDILTRSLILTAAFGALGNDSNPDDPDPICTCEADTDDIIRQEANGYADLDKQRRKSSMLLVWPDAAKATECRLAFDGVHPSSYKRAGGRPGAYVVFRAGPKQAAGDQSKVPRGRSLQAA